ncbi:MAG: DUF3536 domain-containing protein [Nitrospiraceae bacterium]|nr:MAG: DUF3536 domain-containing protein [Nitrospiraceae bacterium]
MNRYICIHGHFYQPPRENAWLEEVELQDSSYPYHDWNERITAECYAPNTASRILDKDGKIVDIVNNYAKMSFNFGPTLLSWLERHRPEIYQAIIDADRQSMEYFSGHGSAMAQVYNHMIMPLANRRDKYTQAIWGIRDFEHRFKRFPEGMWLPETAADLATLEILADLGISFTVFAPQQANRAREIRRGSRWKNASGGKIDPTTPYLCRLPSGRTITIFFYDSPISQDIAFGGLLGSGEEFAKRLLNAFSEDRTLPQLVHIATDGETYGHHHRGGEMALAYCIHYIESKKLAKLTNYGEFLSKHPPEYEIDIFENSSWSCIHGIERWRGHCGCSSGMHPEWTQEWRKPLREALDELRFSAIAIYEKNAGKYLKYPWKARNDYISVILGRTEAAIKKFLLKHAVRELEHEETVRVLKLLELQRNAMLMYTSCGWFFDEISGIETMQILQYASKAIQLAEELQAVTLETGFMEALEGAPSNVYKNGREPYELFVRPAKVNLLRAGAHYAVSSVFQGYKDQTKIFCYSAGIGEYSILDTGMMKLVIGKASITNDITLDAETIYFAVLHRGYHDIIAGVKSFTSENDYSLISEEIRPAFEKEDAALVIRLIHKHFGENIFSLAHLFRDEQRKIVQQILQMTFEGIETSCRKIYDSYRETMGFFRSFGVNIPKPFRASAEYILNSDLKHIFEGREVDTEKLKKLIQEVLNWSLDVDRTTIGFVAGSRITSLMEELSLHPDNTELIDRVENILKIISTFPVELDLWKAQNIYFSLGKKLYKPFRDKTPKAESGQQKWMEAFRKLGYYLHVKIA